ncbi:MAG: AEC family transporter [Clostridiales bacterium]|nr:AEC family transporter [Clostridiales bacterium]
MELALITMGKICEMFVILLIGALAFKTGILDSASNKHLSSLLLKVISPALIFMSYQIDFEPERLQGLILMLGLSLLSYVWSILVVNLALPKGKNGNVEIERISAIYSNCGFIGIPLINAIVGKEGVFYMTAYITIYNLMIWSHGLATMCGTTDIRTVLKNFVQPATIAIGLGIICFVGRIHLPSVIANPLDLVGDMNTAVAMLVAGCNLMESDLIGALKRPRSYYVCFLKLLLVPFVSILILKFIPVNSLFITTLLVAIACPAGAMGTMMALQYDKDSNYATELFTLTTIFSLVTIPIVILLMGILIR